MRRIRFELGFIDGHKFNRIIWDGILNLNSILYPNRSDLVGFGLDLYTWIYLGWYIRDKSYKIDNNLQAVTNINQTVMHACIDISLASLNPVAFYISLDRTYHLCSNNLIISESPR